MKTLFFSAVEVIEEKNLSKDEIGNEGTIYFNTSHILSPHQVLSALKVSIYKHLGRKSLIYLIFLTENLTTALPT